MKKLITSGLVMSMLFASGIAMAETLTDDDARVTGDLTLEKRVYQHDGFGAQWAFDVGSDGLWFVNKAPVSGSYDAPFKIDNNASANALVVGSSEEGKEGYVGIGTDAPQNPLNVAWSGVNDVGDGLTRVVLLSANNSGSKGSAAGFTMRNDRDGRQWDFRTAYGGTGFMAVRSDIPGAEFLLRNEGPSVINTNLYLGSGASCVNGVWINKSSRASKENIHELSAKEAMATVDNLKPVVYNYKTDKQEQYVGFIAEDVPELVAINSRDGLSAMDMVAVLTKVVQEQDKKIEKLESNQIKIDTLQKRLFSLESILIN